MRLVAVGLVLFSWSASAQAPCVSPEHRHLDYWVGEWDLVWNAGPDSLGRGTNSITMSHGGCVIEERFEDVSGFVGHSLSMFDARSGQWRQTWVDNQGSYLLFTGQAREDGTLELRTAPFVNRGGVTQINRMIWQDVSDDALTWRWQQSLNEGETWSDAWVIEYTRRD